MINVSSKEREFAEDSKAFGLLLGSKKVGIDNGKEPTMQNDELSGQFQNQQPTHNSEPYINQDTIQFAPSQPS